MEVKITQSMYYFAQLLVTEMRFRRIVEAMKTAGIVGGLGPETTAEFYRMIIRRAREVYTEAYPRVLIHSIPVPFELERSMVTEGRGEEKMRPLLEEGVARLEKSGADFISIPCNTVHMFHRELQERVGVPLLNILEETAKLCRRAGFERVGVLGTGKTVDLRLYQRALENVGIVAVEPSSEDKRKSGELIYRILSAEHGRADRELLFELAEGLRGGGAEAIILGCTDLQHLISSKAQPFVLGKGPRELGKAGAEEPAIVIDEGASSLPLVDSLEALAAAVVRELAD